MKVNFLSLSGFVVVLLCCSLTDAFSQEGTPSNEIQDLDYHPELNLNEDKTLIFEPEKTTTGNERTSQSKEQLIPTYNSRSAKTKSSENTSKPSAAKNHEEDALSFNFLYYIIQKFKISDIVEQ